MLAIRSTSTLESVAVLAARPVLRLQRVSWSVAKLPVEESNQASSTPPTPPRCIHFFMCSFAATRGDVATMSDERKNQDGLLLDSLAEAQQKLQVIPRDNFAFCLPPLRVSCA